MIIEACKKLSEYSNPGSIVLDDSHVIIYHKDDIACISVFKKSKKGTLQCIEECELNDNAQLKLDILKKTLHKSKGQP